MAEVFDYSLFPNKEEWGTGDEAMDNRLSLALKKVKADISFSNISEFYFYGLGLKPRAHNPAFHSTVEFVTKAFLFYLFPEEHNDSLMKKIKGAYDQKQKIIFDFPAKSEIHDDLKKNKIHRYKNQIDFYLHHQDKEERNPFVRHLLKRSNWEINVKIIMKDFKFYLNGEKEMPTIDDPFFHALRGGEKILLIENFGEIWYHQDQVFFLTTLEF